MPQEKPCLLRGTSKTMQVLIMEAPIKRESVYPRPQIRKSKAFILIWVLSFAALFSVFYAVGFVPKGVAEAGDAVISFFRAEKNSARIVTSSAAKGNDLSQDTPMDAGAFAGEPRILIDDINLDAGIVFPKSTDLNILNTALTKGVVYYPGSGKLGEVGNVFLFGHSTGLKVIYNKNFEVFNRLKELEAGDVIRVQSDGREYWYRVLSMTIQKADDANINLSTTRKLLTISTCRIFGAKEDRYVVEAEFMKSYPLRMATSAADTSS